MLAEVGDNELVTVTQMVDRLADPPQDGWSHEHRPLSPAHWTGRRQMRVRLMRLVAAGLLRCKARGTDSGRGGMMLFARAEPPSGTDGAGEAQE